MDNKTYLGSALPLALSAQLLEGALTAQVSGVSAGWPTGANHRLFVVEIDSGETTEERVLCSLLSGSGGTATVTILTRGYDGTSDQQHEIAATFVHVLDAIVIDQLVTHVEDPSEDDHTQYLTADRHDVAVRHTFDTGTGGAYGTPVAPAPIVASATGATVGVADGPPHADHTHVIADGAIDRPQMLGPNVIVTAAIAAGAVINSDIGANSVSPSELQIGMGIVAVANHDVAPVTADATHIALPPDPATVTLWRQLDKKRLYASDGTAWRWLSGSPIKCALSYHSDGNPIANDFIAHALTGFTADSNEFGMASGGGLFTIPADVAGPPAYKFDGEWDFFADILVPNDGATTFQLWLILANPTLNILVDSQSNAPSHSTLLLCRKPAVPLAAGQTAQLALSHSGSTSLAVQSGSTFETRYRGGV